MNRFKDFVSRGNVMGIAVGVLIGGALGKVTNSLVDDLLMPPLGFFLGRVDFDQIFMPLDGKVYATLADAKVAGAPILHFGNFLHANLNFFMFAFAMIFLVKQVNRWAEKRESLRPPTRACPECLSDVPLGAKKCRFCASRIKK